MSLSDNAIADLVEAGEAREILILPVDMIDPDPDQPRKIFNEKSIMELAETIESDGQLQPIVIREHGERYQIVVGERRWRACHFVASKRVECLLVSMKTAARILVAQLVENIQREDMSPLEEAHSFRRLIELKECKNAVAVARRVGKSEASISQSLKLLELPEEIQELVATGVASVDSALDVHAIQQDEPETATKLISDAKAKGKLERKTTRGVKNRIKERSVTPATAKRAPAIKEPPNDVIPLHGAAARIFVGIHPDSDLADAFAKAVEVHGEAELAPDCTHRDPNMAWVAFGTFLGAFACAELTIVSIKERIHD